MRYCWVWLAAAAVGLSGCTERAGRAEHGCGGDPAQRPPLRLVVMDPLAAPLACACVEGYAQRDYQALARFLEDRLGRPVLLLFTEALAEATGKAEGPVHLVIGKHSVVRYDARRLGMAIGPIARLTGREGTTSQHGLFVVRAEDGVDSLAGLDARQVVLGPVESDEKHAAAIAAMRQAGLELPDRFMQRADCANAALDVVEGRARAAVISSYAVPLLEGCGTIDKGRLKVIGRTAAVPFITAFVTDAVDRPLAEALKQSLSAVKGQADLCRALESGGGFVVEQAWTDFRGPGRDGMSPWVPSHLPQRVRLAWSVPVSGPGPAGLSCDDRYVVAAGKSPDGKQDVWWCLDADTGRQVWRLAYPAAGEMDYSNVPRATPVIDGPVVYLLGAFGHLHCVELASGRVRWKKHLVEDLDAERPHWGISATPLVVGDKLIVSPGGRRASLAALDKRTGRVLWQGVGEGAAYASPVAARLGGVEQVVAYDAISLGGWDLRTGRRLWRILPPVEGDYNVPTPLVLDGRVMVVTENNGARLYGFDRQGRALAQPVGRCERVLADTVSPVAVGSLVLCPSGGRLYALDATDGLKVLWSVQDEAFYDYLTMITDGRNVLLTLLDGRLLLGRADRRGWHLLGQLKVFDGETEVWSHPALMPGRLYLRSHDRLVCLGLE